jgi:hypothetical protein
MKKLSGIFIVLMSLILNITACTRDEKDISGDDELDIQREEEYKPGDFSERELELNH